MEYFTALSSEVYYIDPKDLKVLEDAGKDLPKIKSDKVAILLGSIRDGVEDKLYQGRDVVLRAVKDKKEYIPVRVAFKTRTAGFNFVASLIKGIRKNYNAYGSNTYHVRLKDLEKARVERGVRTEKNAYRFSSQRRWVVKDFEREDLIKKMEKSFKEKGYDDKYPMDILLCRAFGVKDNLHQGHHRMMFSRKFKIERVAVKFMSASHMTPFLRPVFVFLQKISERINRYGR